MKYYSSNWTNDEFSQSLVQYVWNNLYLLILIACRSIVQYQFGKKIFRGFEISKADLLLIDFTLFKIY